MNFVSLYGRKFPKPIARGVMNKSTKRTAKICGAFARSTGNPCQCKLLLRGGRCRLHGGLSTGPKTAVGKAKALLSMREGWQRWREARIVRARESLIVE